MLFIRFRIKVASYVGQTCKQLKSRITEHKNHIRWNTSTRNVITEHRLQEGHDFDWNNVTILDEEPYYRKRLISEMIFIRRRTDSTCRRIWRGFSKPTSQLQTSYKMLSCVAPNQSVSLVHNYEFFWSDFLLLSNFHFHRINYRFNVKFVHL